MKKYISANLIRVIKNLYDKATSAVLPFVQKWLNEVGMSSEDTELMLLTLEEV